MAQIVLGPLRYWHPKNQLNYTGMFEIRLTLFTKTTGIRPREIPGTTETAISLKRN